jgi:signal transduction histidine kinase/CheY-like chemotaxis protein
MVETYFADSERPFFEALLRRDPEIKTQRELQLRVAGTFLPVLIAAAPLQLAGTVALCLVVTDLTEQKKHQGVREESRRKDEFLAMLAHELRNPLAPIQNAVCVLQHVDSSDERLGYARSIIGRQVTHLSRLVDDLLDVSRITLGKVKLQKEPIDLAAIVARAVETSRPGIEARRHQLTVTLPREPLRLEGDPTRLAQVIGNLLANAAKYTDEGGKIFLSAARNDGEIIVRVRDTGIGISADLLPRIFDLFIQGDRSLARSEGGLGIGLSLVHRLVELHGGSVRAHSDGIGQGSEFVVRLPALEAPSHGETPPLKGVGPSNGVSRRRILIVEDNIDGAESLAMLLNLIGHVVYIAYTGLEALETAKIVNPQYVLLDIGLPGMSGYEVARHLRELPAFAATKLIAMTGYGQEEDKQNSREAGFNHHLVKPVDPEVLLGLLQTS